MLAFVDESGDAGMALERGSSRYFTIAVVTFQAAEDALGCQRSIEALRHDLQMSERAEFHFHSDGHERRLALLDVLRRQQFQISSFTLNKASPRLVGPGYQVRESLYKNVCKMAMENCDELLTDAKVVIDGSGERLFRQQLQTYLRRSVMNSSGPSVASVSIKRSQSDPLLQVADYCAGVVNRHYMEGTGAAEYMAKLRRRFIKQRLWP